MSQICNTAFWWQKVQVTLHSAISNQHIVSDTKWSSHGGPHHSFQVLPSKYSMSLRPKPGLKTSHKQNVICTFIQFFSKSHTRTYAVSSLVMRHNGGFCNNCTPKRCLDNGHTGAFPNKCTIKHPCYTTAAWKVWKFMKNTSLIRTLHGILPKVI